MTAEITKKDATREIFKIKDFFIIRTMIGVLTEDSFKAYELPDIWNFKVEYDDGFILEVGGRK